MTAIKIDTLVKAKYWGNLKIIKRYATVFDFNRVDHEGLSSALGDQ